MRALAGGILRAFKNHKSPEGAAYRRYWRGWAARFGGSVPSDVREDLRQAALIAARDLPRLNADLERARGKRRNSLERKVKSFRVSLVMFERQIAARVNGHKPNLADYVDEHYSERDQDE